MARDSGFAEPGVSFLPLVLFAVMAFEFNFLLLLVHAALPVCLCTWAKRLPFLFIGAFFLFLSKVLDLFLFFFANPDMPENTSCENNKRVNKISLGPTDF